MSRACFFRLFRHDVWFHLEEPVTIGLDARTRVCVRKGKYTQSVRIHNAILPDGQPLELCGRALKRGLGHLAAFATRFKRKTAPSNAISEYG